jgi:hypothetical protein
MVVSGVAGGVRPVGMEEKMMWECGSRRRSIQLNVVMIFGQDSGIT